MGTHATALAQARRADTWLHGAAAQAQGAHGPAVAQKCHDLRNRLGSLQAALDVLDVFEPGSATAIEAEAVVARQSAELARLLDDLQQEGPWATR